MSYKKYVKKNENNEVQKQGIPWAIAGKYQSYDEAIVIKEQLEEAVARGDVLGKQYKIQRMRDPEHFVIKARTHPEFQEQEKASAKAKKKTKTSENTTRSGKPRRTKKDQKGTKKR